MTNAKTSTLEALMRSSFCVLCDHSERFSNDSHKIAVSRKECRESRYWLRLIAYADKRASPLAVPLVQEASELIAILTTIRKNSESDDDRGS
jgi:hypothetical protein